MHVWSREKVCVWSEMDKIPKDGNYYKGFITLASKQDLEIKHSVLRWYKTLFCGKEVKYYSEVNKAEWATWDLHKLLKAFRSNCLLLEVITLLKRRKKGCF